MASRTARSGDVERHLRDVPPVGFGGSEHRADVVEEVGELARRRHLAPGSPPGSRGAITLDTSSGPDAAGRRDGVGVLEAFDLDGPARHGRPFRYLNPDRRDGGRRARPRTRPGDPWPPGRRRSVLSPGVDALERPLLLELLLDGVGGHLDGQCRRHDHHPLAVAHDDVARHHGHAGAGDRDLVVERQVQPPERGRVRGAVVHGEVEGADGRRVAQRAVGDDAGRAPAQWPAARRCRRSCRHRPRRAPRSRAPRPGPRLSMARRWAFWPPSELPACRSSRIGHVAEGVGVRRPCAGPRAPAAGR